ncbi:GAF domain-containing protein [Modestobacter sp. SSW1-42]|uniref:GAF domain-containing protein n=1 Tax=Modestobacter sp. SSW1-42 TaxID=596372 RepID=UPI003986D08B
MTLAARFAAALAAEEPAAGDAEGHLLPRRLARAVVRVLPVDGAGLCALGDPARRTPLGGSSPDAELAERLQFTVGSGPCLQAWDTGHPVFAVDADLRRRWPLYAEQLFGRTPWRGVVSLPVRRPRGVAGALDLFFTDPGGVARMDVFDALSVIELLTVALSDAALMSTWSAAEGPAWLQGPPAVHRAAVWRALGETGLALGRDTDEALALLRARAWVQGSSVDTVAADLLSGRLAPQDLLDAA